MLEIDFEIQGRNPDEGFRPDTVDEVSNKDRYFDNKGFGIPSGSGRFNYDPHRYERLTNPDQMGDRALDRRSGYRPKPIGDLK